MAKRPADEPLEDIMYQGSPSIKKVRLESVPEQDTGSNGISHLSDELFTTSDRQDKTDVPRLDQIEEGLQDSEQDSDFDEEHARRTPPNGKTLPPKVTTTSISIRLIAFFWISTSKSSVPSRYQT